MAGGFGMPQGVQNQNKILNDSEPQSKHLKRGDAEFAENSRRRVSELRDAAAIRGSESVRLPVARQFRGHAPGRALLQW